MSKKIILTGGGTCGHIMPNIALLPLLKQHFESISYIGESNSREEKLAKQHDLPFYYTDAIRLERKKFWKNIAIPYVLHNAEQQASTILQLLQPSVVFSKGGYVSIPTCLACKKLGIPLVIHESDATLGVANKYCAKWATKIITSHSTTPLIDERYIYLGNPIREELMSGNKRSLESKLRLDKKRKNILIVGGSLGATAINEVIFKCLPQLSIDYNILHITGNNSDNLPTSNNYYPINYVDNIGDYYAAADIIISRAGASAITEIGALGKRAIYIPLPKGNSRGDQVDNALKIADGDRIQVIEQDKLACDTLCTAISSALSVDPPAPNYDRNTVKNIVNLLISLTK